MLKETVMGEKVMKNVKAGADGFCWCGPIPFCFCPLIWNGAGKVKAWDMDDREVKAMDAPDS